MYDNFQQPPPYEPLSGNFYTQPMYSNQYEQGPYIDNTYMNQQYQPTYQAVSQQPTPVYQSVPEQQPPSYAMAVQSPAPSAPVMQQPTNNNSIASGNSSRPQGTPFSKGYKWPRKSISIVCPQCGATVTTRVETSITVITIIGAVILCIFTCILTCLPFCIPACKRSTHYCPYCNSVLGIRSPLR
ncbi:unnamed protein product [Adineta steineri]|uniref:LITAF domain-containing protein n=1 Tax=Adineta steineri TaxID=433720 RepID=A0A819NX14_9BILA|nr:unnamed protein product [Adineta steineri]CAF1441624.1 unnamed protein product [Adineta steineri]CAF3942817.1 unnamed protein product [Adineta steineri]CAF4003615.1 unnamed protein product [Adineta steineri]